jgi:hypothetical protein
MSGTRRIKKQSNLKKLTGHPGLYTFVSITHDIKKEKALWAKIVRDARKLRNQILANGGIY